MKNQKMYEADDSLVSIIRDNYRVKVLLGRQVIAFPDLGACDRWRKKAKDYPLLDITVSDYLEKNATPQQREMGADLADLVVEERMAEGEAKWR